MKSLTFPAFFILILWLSSCKSPLSEGEAKAISAIIAKIEIEQNLSNKKDNHVTVSLYDKDNKPIDNKNIIVKVNNLVLDTVEVTRLYYFNYNIYRMEHIPVADNYQFEIVLTDSQTYFLGAIKPIEEIDEKNILFDEKGNFDKDFIMTWSNLKEVNELSLSKSVLLKSSTKLEMSYPYEGTESRKISGQGKFILPKSTYINSKSILSGVEFKFTASKFGLVNRDLAKGSEIKISGDLDKYVDFDEESKFAK